MTGQHPVAGDPGDPGVGQSGSAEPAAAGSRDGSVEVGLPTDMAEGERSRRPLPGPSPTSRARRAAAAGVEARRPSPRPTRPMPVPADVPAEPPDPTAQPGSANRAGDQTALATVESGVLATRTAPTADPATERSAGRRAPRWLALLLGLVVLAAAGALVLAARLSSGAGSVSDRDQALSAAKTEVPLILSYDYATFDADVAKARAQLTGRAATDYTTAMARTIKPAAVKVKAVVQAQTDGAGVEAVSPDGQQVTVVVFGEQKVTNSSLSAPRTDLFRVRATLNLVSGHWLVSKFDQI
ncbi:MAG: hypothetical protein ACJ74U_14225 [Jatrophihabitantaceae bacterium]